jgi:hypothetical protein
LAGIFPRDTRPLGLDRWDQGAGAALSWFSQALDRVGASAAGYVSDVIPIDDEPRLAPQGLVAPSAADMPIGNLTGRLSDATVRLVRDQVRLARAEMAQKTETAGVGLGLLGGPGVFVFYGISVLVAAAGVGLVLGWRVWEHRR